MRIAYLIDPPGSLDASTDSSVEMIRTHATRGDKVHVVLRDGICCSGDAVSFGCFPIEVSDDDGNWFKLGPREAVPSTGFDALAIRLEPPVDVSYVKVCQMLAIAQKQGLKVANDPVAIITRDEKISALAHPDLIPKTLVGTSRAALLDFANSLDNGCMIKPIGIMGGQGVFSLGKNDSNIQVAIDFMLNEGKTVLVQERLQEIKDGDRRVFLVGGKVYGQMLNRLPAKGSHLANMAAGGEACAMETGDAEKTICEKIGPGLARAGVSFAGLDVIDGRLTEINITCPTGLRALRDLTGQRVAEDVIEAMFGDS